VLSRDEGTSHLLYSVVPCREEGTSLILYSVVLSREEGNPLLLGRVEKRDPPSSTAE